MDAHLTGTYAFGNAQLDLNLVLADTANPDGTYTVLSGTGTDIVNGTTYDTVVDPAGADSNPAGSTNDNHVFLSSPYVSPNGLGIDLTVPSDHADLFSTATNGNMLRDATGLTVSLSVTIAPVCFASGTLIRTTRGDVAVEALRVGDLVVTTAGEHRAIRWLGHRTVDCRRHPRPHEVMPVRVAAHGFGDNRPARDLLVSPGHALCIEVLGEVLIPASALVNGTSITQESVDCVTYWHIELDSHDVILAENLPCESYLDMGNRRFFAESSVSVLHASPDAHPVDHTDFCRPFHQDGAIVACVRERLAARAPGPALPLWVAAPGMCGDAHVVSLAG